jgi:hypothetical protein
MNRQTGYEWSDTVVWCDQLLYGLRLLQSATVQCLGYFIFFADGVGKKRKGSANDKGKNKSVHEVAKYTTLYIKYIIS